MNKTDLRQQYENAREEDWNGHPLYSERFFNEWFPCLQAFYEWQESRQPTSEWEEAKTSIKGICDFGLLYMSEPNYLPTLYFSDDIDLPDDCDDLSELMEPDHPILLKLAELNKLIEETKFVLSYSEGDSKPSPASLTLNRRQDT